MPKTRTRRTTTRPVPGATPPAAFTTLIELLPDAVVVAGKDGEIRVVNGQAARMFGYSRRELLRMNVEDLIPAPLKDVHLRHRAAFNSRPSIRMMGHGLELVAVKKDGTEFPVEIGLSPLGPKRSLEVISVVRDISDRKQSEEELRESELRYRSLVDLSPEAIIVHVEGKILYANQAAAKLFALDTPQDLIGKSVVDFVPTGYRELVQQRMLSPALPGQSLPPMVIRTRRLDGVEVILETIASRAPYRGMFASQVILRDITERERAQAEVLSSRERLRNLSTYLQSAREEERTAIAREIHDELGQALTALNMDLVSIVELLKHSDDQKSTVAVSSKLASMSSVIGTTIQAVRRISTELRPVLLDSLGLGAAVEWQAEDFQTRTGIACEVSVVPDDLMADRDRSTAVFRILQETLTNIARHSGATGVTVHLEGRDGALLLEVHDNGKGIAESDMSKTASFGLLGMRERALLFGGTVDIQGLQGRGTTVTVRIPLR